MAQISRGNFGDGEAQTTEPVGGCGLMSELQVGIFLNRVWPRVQKHDMEDLKWIFLLPRLFLVIMKS